MKSLGINVGHSLTCLTIREGVSPSNSYSRAHKSSLYKTQYGPKKVKKSFKCYGKNKKSEIEEEGIFEKINNTIKLFLGPISLSFGSDIKKQESVNDENKDNDLAKKAANLFNISLGPISLSYSNDFGRKRKNGNNCENSSITNSNRSLKSINNMTNEEWKKKYQPDGTIDLWVEEEFNAGSRLVGGRDVYKGGVYGKGTGEGPSGGDTVMHHVKIYNRDNNEVFEVDVPSDRYILWEAEDNGFKLPYSCRMGCCTACAVKIKSGRMYQPQSMGISKELKDKGYALMCVGYPKSDLVLEVVEEDEVYDLQFGSDFQRNALNKKGENIKRDDFALELADMDE